MFGKKPGDTSSDNDSNNNQFPSGLSYAAILSETDSTSTHFFGAPSSTTSTTGDGTNTSSSVANPERGASSASSTATSSSSQYVSLLPLSDANDWQPLCDKFQIPEEIMANFWQKFGCIDFDQLSQRWRRHYFIQRWIYHLWQVVALIGQVGLLQDLIAEDRSLLTTTDEYGRGLLHLAALGGNYDGVLYLLEQHQLRPQQTDHFSQSALHYAALSGNLELIKLLVKTYRLDVNAMDYRGRNALHYAALSGNSEAVLWLVETSLMNPNSKDKHGCTILHLAIQSGSCGSVQTLKQKYPWLTTELADTNGAKFEHYAAKSENQQLIDEYVTEPDARDTAGRTPLAYAAYAGDLHTIRYLIDNKHADPLIDIDNEGKSALYYAASGGNPHAARLFVNEYKLDPSHMDKLGNTPLHAAALSGSLPTVRYFIEERFPTAINPGRLQQKFKNKAERNTYLCAALGGCPQLLEWLTAHTHLDPMAQDSGGNTALHLAAQSGFRSTVAWLADNAFHSVSVNTHTLLARLFVEDSKNIIDSAFESGIPSCVDYCMQLYIDRLQNFNRLRVRTAFTENKQWDIFGQLSSYITYHLCYEVGSLSHALKMFLFACHAPAPHHAQLQQKTRLFQLYYLLVHKDRDDHHKNALNDFCTLLKALKNTAPQDRYKQTITDTFTAIPVSSPYKVAGITVKIHRLRQALEDLKTIPEALLQQCVPDFFRVLREKMKVIHTLDEKEQKILNSLNQSLQLVDEAVAVSTSTHSSKP